MDKKKILETGQLGEKDLADEDLNYYKEVILIGECYLSVINFVREEITMGVFRSANREHKFENKMWLHGTARGSVKGSIFIMCSPVIRQLVCGVNTEEAKVQKSVSIVVGDSKNAKFRKIRDELRNLMDLKKNLEDNEFNILGKNVKSGGNKKMQEELDDMKRNLQNMLQILQKSETEKSISFVYHSHEELFKSQEIFIDIGMNLIEYCAETNDDCEKLFYECLKSVLKRGELSLQL